MWVTATLVADHDSDCEQRVQCSTRIPHSSPVDAFPPVQVRRRDGPAAQLQPRVGVPHRNECVNRVLVCTRTDERTVPHGRVTAPVVSTAPRPCLKRSRGGTRSPVPPPANGHREPAPARPRRPRLRHSCQVRRASSTMERRQPAPVVGYRLSFVSERSRPHASRGSRSP